MEHYSYTVGYKVQLFRVSNPASRILKMKLFGFFAILLLLTALLTVEAAPVPDPAPGKIKTFIKVAKKTGEVAGKALRTISIADTAHDIYSFVRGRKRKH